MNALRVAILTYVYMLKLQFQKLPKAITEGITLDCEYLSFAKTSI